MTNSLTPTTANLSSARDPRVERAMRVRVAIAAFLAQHGKNTRLTYQQAIQQLFELFDVDPAEVTLPHAVSFKQHLIKQGRSDATVYGRLSALRSLWAFLMEPQLDHQPIVTSNPWERVSRSDVKPTPYGRSKPASWETLQKLLDVIPPTPIGFRDKAILLFFAFTGRRLSEVAKLLIKDLDLKNDPPRYTVVTKGNQVKTFEMPKVVIEAMRAYWIAADRIDDLRPDAAVFTAWRGSALTAHHSAYAPLTTRSVDQILRRWIVRAKLPLDSIHIHAIRHLAASDLDKAGVRLQDIQAFLGHASPTTTSIYINRLNQIGPAHEAVLTRVRAKAMEAAKAAF